MRNGKPKAPPDESASAELVELVIHWLRKHYGDRAVDAHMLWILSWRLGDVERCYNADPNATAVAKVGP